MACGDGTLPATQNNISNKLNATKAQRTPVIDFNCNNILKRNRAKTVNIRTETKPRSQNNAVYYRKDAAEHVSPKTPNPGVFMGYTLLYLPMFQVTCGPITGEPEDSAGAEVPAAKGKLVVPLSAAEKAEKRQQRANTNRRDKKAQRSNDGRGGGSGGTIHDNDSAVDFVHLKTPGRNYAVLQVGGASVIKL